MALMSCGPAFLAVVVEAMADAGGRVTASSPPQAAAAGGRDDGRTAAYLDANDLDAAELRRRVATPGGVTENGLLALEDDGVRGRSTPRSIWWSRPPAR